ncbi:hypothetical protein HBA55_34930 [Pseudomaricurvus alkylphenolicus]|uniref:hypothetical protein n=1 Tax=Pseudomaricurvus alkylphenolicus TaxID=1306991 RepID=UPI00141E3009|nr:hypothetical protein [Pseudomaricurvus alkylphenolicus]NIB44828.1 hypothetical protein [Pseudomaricurvus alkylphenolicus]
MGYFYVSSVIGGRTTGGALTKQTGSFASLGAANVYASYADAQADGYGSGDIMCVSEDHDESASGLTLTGPQSGDGGQLICVDDANCDTPVKASSKNFQHTGGGSFLTYDGIFYMCGLWSKAANDIVIASTNTFSMSEDCTFEADGSFDRCLNISADGGYHLAINPTFKVNNTAAHLIGIGGGSVIDVVGGSVDAAVKPAAVFGDMGTRGFTSRLDGVDFTNVTNYILEDIGGTIGSDDNISVRMRGCKVASGLTAFVEEEFTNYTHRFEAYNCSSDSAAAEYQFHVQGYGGYVDDQDDAGIHRDESMAFPGGEKVSLHCVTNGMASLATPFFFDLPDWAVDLSNASSNKLRVYLVSTDSLTDLDFWLRVMFPDGTNKNLWNHADTRNPDRLATVGVTLSSDTGSTWKDGASPLTGYNLYYIDIDTSVIGNGGANSVPKLRAFAAKPNAVIYLCTDIGALAA